MGAFTPVSGIVGRVTKSGVAVASLSEWRMTKTTQAVNVYTFEAIVDTGGNIWPTVLPGLSLAKVSFAGVFDSGNPNDSTVGLTNGVYVTMSFILVRATPFGFNQVDVFIDQVEFGTNVENQPAKFSGTGTVNGTPGLTTTVTG